MLLSGSYQGLIAVYTGFDVFLVLDFGILWSRFEGKV